MIAVFLQAELVSPRFRETIQRQLDVTHQPHTLIEAPDLSSATENAARRQLLASYRAYLFDDLPSVWHWAVLSAEELAEVRYIDYSYWNELSCHTRLARVAAESIRSGREVFGVSSEGFWSAVQALHNGATFPPLILTQATRTTPLTVIEGHVRLTAYFLAPECLPPQLEVLAGVAPACV